MAVNGETELSRRPNYVLQTLARFAEYGDREAIVSGERRMSYAELRTEVLNLAAALHHGGARSGMAVCVLILHPIESPALSLALHLLGCRSVWVDANSLTRELDDYLRQVPPDLLVYDARSCDPMGREFAARLGTPVLCLGSGGSGADLLAAATDAFDAERVAAEPEAVFQTSGTTGLPKAIHHRQNLYDQLFVLADELIARGEADTRHLNLSRLCHPSGQTQTMLYLFCGATVVFMSPFELEGFLRTIERERITSIFISPLMFYRLLDSPALDRADLSSVKLISVGGAAAAPARLRQGVQRLGQIVRITYGLGETPFISAFPGVAEDPRHPERLRSCGQPYGDVRIEVRAEDGTVLPPGEVGEFWVASALNFAGYWGQPRLTAETLVDGWLRTRDQGYVDADGYLYIVGRVHDMILSGAGARCIYPRPIEEALATHPGVQAATVIGVPDPELVESVHAYVLVKQDATVTAEELKDLVRGELNEVWTPRTIEFVDTLPETVIGKVDTKALRSRYAEEHRVP